MLFYLPQNNYFCRILETLRRTIIAFAAHVHDVTTSHHFLAVNGKEASSISQPTGLTSKQTKKTVS
jgi:hypothetical protein